MFKIFGYSIVDDTKELQRHKLQLRIKNHSLSIKVTISNKDYTNITAGVYVATCDAYSRAKRINSFIAKKERRVKIGLEREKS